jgi:hypothetical protein
MNNDNYCYPFIVGGLETVLRHIIKNGYDGIKITDQAAYDKAIENTIADIKEMSKEYYRP